MAITLAVYLGIQTEAHERSGFFYWRNNNELQLFPKLNAQPVRFSGARKLRSERFFFSG